jgi:hypothetical protein
MTKSSDHTFHIPVLGLCYSIDTPLKVARYGISSVVSIIEDELIEDMRAYHSLKHNLDYFPITVKEHDYRANRITSYLNLLQDIVDQQIERLKNAGPDDADIIKYFELLPASPLKQKFSDIQNSDNDIIKEKLWQALKETVKAGSIDVNIMSKVDNNNYSSSGEKLPAEYSDALSALRGFAKSNLTSSVVFSAGYNPRLYGYAEEFNDFYPDEKGSFRKKITLKVSDYRSALIQGKILAKKGLWVSEFRIESGLNCGGHAFPTEGLLLGPILEEFRLKREELAGELYSIFIEALKAKGKYAQLAHPPQKITAQGGVGTALEHQFLLEHFELDSVGWGSPFLLVPEATNVDATTLADLASAKKEDYFLSDASPLGVPFNNFKRSSSESQRKARIEKGRPGSPCYKKYLSSNTEFTEVPICTASREYQLLKEEQIKNSGTDQKHIEAEINKLQEKDCLCEGLTTAVRISNEMYLPHKLSAVAICPGPNLAYFSGVFSLRNMVDHIYGRCTITNSLPRAHMFINELQLYIDYLKKKVSELIENPAEKQHSYLVKFRANLLAGLSYYRNIANLLPEKFYAELNNLEEELFNILKPAIDRSAFRTA